MGSSEAAGYVTAEDRITSWLNELAFAPVDYNAMAPREMSGRATVAAGYSIFRRKRSSVGRGRRLAAG